MWSELVINEIFEPVTSLGCGSEPQPVFGGNPVKDMEEGAGSNVVALVCDHETVVGREIFNVVAAGKCGQKSYVDNAGGL
jgi:hypothetical protein